MGALRRFCHEVQESHLRLVWHRDAASLFVYKSQFPVIIHHFKVLL